MPSECEGQLSDYIADINFIIICCKRALSAIRFMAMRMKTLAIGCSLAQLKAKS